MKKSILIVEDNDDFRGMIRDYLKKHKLRLNIYEASTGEMGIIQASCVRPNIVLMDINLPQANGVEVARQIKKDFPNCDLIFLTMFDVGAFKKQAEKLKARDFISKDHVYDKLLPAIKKCL